MPIIFYISLGHPQKSAGPYPALRAPNDFARFETYRTSLRRTHLGNGITVAAVLTGKAIARDSLWVAFCHAMLATLIREPMRLKTRIRSSPSKLNLETHTREGRGHGLFSETLSVSSNIEKIQTPKHPG